MLEKDGREVFFFSGVASPFPSTYGLHAKRNVSLSFEKEVLAWFASGCLGREEKRISGCHECSLAPFPSSDGWRRKNALKMPSFGARTSEPRRRESEGEDVVWFSRAGRVGGRGERTTSSLCNWSHARFGFAAAMGVCSPPQVLFRLFPVGNVEGGKEDARSLSARFQECLSATQPLSM